MVCGGVGVPFFGSVDSGRVPKMRSKPVVIMMQAGGLINTARLWSYRKGVPQLMSQPDKGPTRKSVFPENQWAVGCLNSNTTYSVRKKLLLLPGLPSSAKLTPSGCGSLCFTSPRASTMACETSKVSQPVSIRVWTGMEVPVGESAMRGNVMEGI